MSTSVVDLVPVEVSAALEIERARFQPVMSMDLAIDRRKVVQRAIRELMEDGQDYGTVPGINKPTLLQPGAQKLDNLFGLVPRYSIESMEEDWTGERHAGEPFFRYMVRCQNMRGEFVMGEGIGECNSWESKYRFRAAERKCPSCGVGAIIAGKKEYGGGFVCFKKKGGCGAKFSETDQSIVGQETGRKPNPEIFDQVNTILKMAEKRAHMLATINATSASEFFTQDVEDTAKEEPIDTGDHPTDQVRDQKVTNSPSVYGRPVPEELQLVFRNIDKDFRAVSEAYKMLESELAEKGGTKGTEAYARIVQAFRAKFPRVNGKLTETKLDHKDCLLDLWDQLQTFAHPVPE